MLQFRATGTHDPVPVWHDRSAEAGPLLRPPRASRLDDELLLVHRRCMRGTGGCMDWPYRLGKGTVDPLRRAYLDELRASIPDEWGLWKGVHLKPADLTVAAPVYVPADVNCCPSFRAEGRVRVSGDAVHLDLVRITPDADSPAWLVDPAEGIGHIRARTSAAALASAYGAAAVRPASISIGQGMCVAGARVFPDTPMEFEVAWVDSTGTRPAFARVTRPGAPWRTPAGVGVGTSLSRLEEIRGGPVAFSGFGWEGSGGGQLVRAGRRVAPDPGARSRGVVGAGLRPPCRRAVWRPRDLVRPSPRSRAGDHRVHDDRRVGVAGARAGSVLRMNRAD